MRRAGRRDLPALVQLAESDAVRPFLARDAAARLPAALEHPDEDLVVFEVDGAVAGGARLVVRNARSRIGEVRSLMVDPHRRGHGLGSGALRALIEWAFGERDLHRLEGEVLGYNDAGLRAFAAAGFEREGVRRRAYLRDEGWTDSVMFAVLADER